MTNPLLSRARLLLGQGLRLHLTSVEIGRYERIADTGVIDAEVADARKILEAMDRLCADLDREQSVRQDGHSARQWA